MVAGKPRWSARTRRQEMAVGVVVAVLAVLMSATSRVDAATPSGAQKVDPKLAPVKFFHFSPLSGGLVLKDFAYTNEKFQDYINKHGGVNGHKVEFTNCDTGGTGAGSIACAQQAVSEKAVALVTSLDLGQGDYVKVLEGAKIPLMTSLVFQSSEKVSPMVFGYGGPDLESGGLALAAKTAGCKKIAVLISNIPGNQALIDVLKRALPAVGVQSLFQDIPAAVGDYTPQVSAALKGDADCVIPGGTTAGLAALLSAINSTGKTPKLILFDGFLNQQLIDQYPKITDGAVLVASTADKEDPAYSAYVKATTGRPANFTEAIGQNLWLGDTLLVNEAKKIKGPITSAAFLKALQHDKSLSANGIQPAVDFTKPLPLLGLNKRDFNPWVRFKVIKNGKTVSLGTWVNATNAYNGKKSSGASTPTTTP